MNRTVASARSFLAGLFTSETNERQIQSKGPFEIEVQHFPDEDMVCSSLSLSILVVFQLVRSLVSQRECFSCS